MVSRSSESYAMTDTLLHNSSTQDGGTERFERTSTSDLSRDGYAVKDCTCECVRMYEVQHLLTSTKFLGPSSSQDVPAFIGWALQQKQI